MQTKTSLYRALAGLFEYPDAAYARQLIDCLALMQQSSPEAAELLKQFRDSTQGFSTEQLQEIFTRSFDLDPTCTLEIGWHLFGEDYRRGEFLVKMRQEMRANGVPESLELPDHLTHALALLDVLDEEESAEFAGQFLLPALHKMRAAWQKSPSAFGTLLEATFVLLSSRFHYEPMASPVQVPELRVLQ